MKIRIAATVLGALLLGASAHAQDAPIRIQTIQGAVIRRVLAVDVTDTADDPVTVSGYLINHRRGRAYCDSTVVLPPGERAVIGGLPQQLQQGDTLRIGLGLVDCGESIVDIEIMTKDGTGREFTWPFSPSE